MNVPYQQLGTSVENQNFTGSPEDLNLPDPAAPIRSEILKKKNNVKHYVSNELKPPSSSYVSAELRPPSSSNSSPSPGHGLQYDEEI